MIILVAVCLLILLALLAVALLSARLPPHFLFQPNLGEALLAETISSGFQRPHHLMNNITLRTQSGTTQIDHVLVAATGVFVIESKHYRGWIFGRPGDPEWTQVIYKRKSRFQNPTRQNYAHVKALQELLGLGIRIFVPIVVFTREAEFKSDLGPNVIKLRELNGFLAKFNTPVLDQQGVACAIGQIEMARMRRSIETDEYHLNSLRRRIRL